MSRKITYDTSKHMAALQKMIAKHPVDIAKYVHQMYKDGLLSKEERDLFLLKHGLIKNNINNGREVTFSCIEARIARNGYKMPIEKIMSIYNDAFVKIVEDMLTPIMEKTISVM